MEQKNRSIIVMAITLIITAALLTSFGRNLFALNTPNVVLPNNANPSDSASNSPEQTDEDPYHLVDVTPDTVQNVIATLSRPGSYAREIAVETFWNGGSSLAQVQVWHDSNVSHIRQVLPSGAIRHDLIDEDMQYYWYEGSTQYRSVSAREASSDLAQHIPTYETVLDLDPASISSAAYVQKDAAPCILVEVSCSSPQRAERYWISLENGLLTAAEVEREGRIVYSMSTNGSATMPCPPGTFFTLPDGTDLISNRS